MNKKKLTTNQKNNKVFIEDNNKLFKLKNIYNKPLSVNEWINNLHSLKINNGNLDIPTVKLIMELNFLFLKNNKKFVKVLKSSNPELVNFKNKKFIRKEQKTFYKNIDDYTKLIDDVIFNVEADWNDQHNFENELNLFNTQLEKINNNNMVKSLLIEKPVEIDFNDLKSKNNIIWNSKLIRSLNSELETNFNPKAYMKYLNELSYNNVANLLVKTVEKIMTTNSIINASEMLWKVLSSKKISVLKVSLFSLINNLQTELVTVKKIVKSLPKQLDGYSSVSELDLLESVLKVINEDEILYELNEEIIYFKKIYDVLFEKCSINQTVAKSLFIKEIKNATNFEFDNKKIKSNTNNNIFIEGDQTKVKFTNALANYQKANDFRLSLQKSIKNVKKLKNEINRNNQINEEVLNIFFQKMNVEFGIVYDLYDLSNLLMLQFENDKYKNNKVKKETEVEKFVKLHTLKLKEKYALNMVYAFIKHHLNNLLEMQQILDIALSKTNDNWLVYFDKWFMLNKSYVKNKKDALEITTKNKTKSKPNKKESNPTKLVKKQDPKSIKEDMEKERKIIGNKFGKAGVKIQEIVQDTNLKINRAKREKGN